jgi:two-component system OmpR family sensor kinase
VSDQTTISLPECVEQTVIDITPLAMSKHIDLQCGSLAQVSIMGDADSLHVMVRNLLDNAVRYAPEYGRVQVDLVKNDSIAVLTVQDSGSGIPERDRGRVFDRFFRVPGTSPSGSGLGLAIVKAIADRHHATVELGDAAFGGLAVKVSFPL